MHATALNAAAPMVLSWSDLASHRGDLVRFARRKLLDPALAEDLVHDVFEAVMTGRAHFAGRSALRTWLVGILKHKIVDLVRQRVGHHSLPDEDTCPGAMPESPAPRPDEVAEQRQRLAQTLLAIEQLSPGLREAVRLRLIEERSTSECCAAMAISEDNLFVRLHRARRQLMQ